MTIRLIPVIVSSESRVEFECIKRDSFQIIDIWELVRSLRISTLGGGTVESDTFNLEALFGGNSVLYHPDSWELLLFRPLLGDSEYNFAKRQLLTALGLLEVKFLSGRATINKISASKRYSNKLIQLTHLCKLFPTSTIKSLAASAPNDFRLGQIIKHVSESREIDHNCSNFSRLLDTDTLNILRSHESVPLMSQEFIAGRLEYRTYLFDSSHTTVAFKRGKTTSATPDIHTDTESLLNPVGVKSTRNEILKLQAIRKSMRLNYCAIDYFRVDGSIKVMEVNPLPSWSWLPDSLRRGITEQLVDMCVRH